ncbi:uncharacterized protein LOC142328364 [Lycorma delicatula]|uniref:uncharacterized protein LOC142328364 n=1 Tax=Lycorma delicatula TaxID=130591 RepID=UPI003F510606
MRINCMQQVDLVELKEEPFNMINGDIPKDPLSIEETISVKSKNVKVENEMEIDKYVIINHVNEDKYNSIEICYLNQSERLNYIKTKISKLDLDSRKLKLYTKYLVTEHDSICRNIVNVNRFVQLSITVINQCLCLTICTFMYLSIEIDNEVMKIVCLGIALLQSVLFYFYCWNGQILIDEYDELRRCLGECSWVDKPQWFKKMLLIMMIRSKAPFQIKPFGLYVINLNNFINVQHLNTDVAFFESEPTTKYA